VIPADIRRMRAAYAGKVTSISKTAPADSPKIDHPTTYKTMAI
jgi:hypothetical protein